MKGKYSSVFGQLNTGPFAQYMRWSIWIDLEEGEKEFTNGDIVFVIQDGRAATTIKCLEDGKYKIQLEEDDDDDDDQVVLLLTQIGLFKTEGLDHVAPSCRRRQASSQKPNVCLKGETHALSTKSHIRKMHQKQVVACTSVDMCDMCATRIPKVFRECASREFCSGHSQNQDVCFVNCTGIGRKISSFSVI